MLADTTVFWMPFFFCFYYANKVYALWQLPEFLPAFDIHPATFKYIMSGAGSWGSLGFVKLYP
jgi:hypothetical protein